MFLHRKPASGFARAVRHLLPSMPGVGRAASAPAVLDTATMMEKLDAALNNMREGCRLRGFLIGRPEPIAHYRHLVAELAEARTDFAVVR